jgi:hypothetical protein
MDLSKKCKGDPMKVTLFLVTSIWLTLAQANYSGIIFEQGSSRKKQLYTMQVEITPKDGSEAIHTVYKDPAGVVALEEQAALQGSQLVRYEIDQKQINQKGVIEVKDGKILFSKTVDGKTSTKDEKLPTSLVTTVNFQKYVKDNWEAISTGKTVSFRYGVWDRQETVGFEIFKTGDEKLGETQATVLKMKPSSFLIAALVKPVIFKFVSDGSRLMEMNGRVAPKKKDGSTFKDLDAEVVYSY